MNLDKTALSWLKMDVHQPHTERSVTMQNYALQPKVGVGVYVMKDGKLLIGKRKGSHGAGEYETPGGHLELMESFVECARREVFEETGMKIGNIRFVRVLNTRRYAPKHYIDIALLADWVSGDPTVREPDKIEGWEWCDLYDLPTPLFGTMPTALEAMRTGQQYWDATEDDMVPASDSEATPLKIYYAASIRGGASFAEMKDRIDFLGTIGDVLTKHMASPESVDMGLADDRAIYDHDRRLLEQCDVFIGDFSQPSTGAGFMAARAAAQGKPVLCLYKEGQKPSAMIAGCPEITTQFFASEADFKDRVRAFLVEHAAQFAKCSFHPLRIAIAGAPGSGKGTVAKKIAAEIGAVHISTGDLLRELTSKKTHPLSGVIIGCMQAGDLVPVAIMRNIVAERLRMPDCRMFGYMLDGYPPSLDDLEGLRENDLLPDLVFFLECSDATAIARQIGRGERATDSPEKAGKRVAVFHREIPSFSALSVKWYPNKIVVRVDAEQTPEKVLAFVRDTIKNLYGPVEREQSFFLIPPYRPEDVRSTRLHFHVDAKDAATLRRIAMQISAANPAAQGQMKIHPIHSLHLGPQIGRMPGVYREMPNFHAFSDAGNEAFITGRLGDGDVDLMVTVLEAAMDHGGMAELEEYLGEWTLMADGGVVTDAAYESTGIDVYFRALARFRNFAQQIYPLELHLGFNIPKQRNEGVPIPLNELTDACTSAGFENGGWFIFKNEQHWAYRCNEFSLDAEEAAKTRLAAQAVILQKILRQRGFVCDISFSLEIVHGIWTAGGAYK